MYSLYCTLLFIYINIYIFFFFFFFFQFPLSFKVCNVFLMLTVFAVQDCVCSDGPLLPLHNRGSGPGPGGEFSRSAFSSSSSFFLSVLFIFHHPSSYGTGGDYILTNCIVLCLSFHFLPHLPLTITRNLEQLFLKNRKLARGGFVTNRATRKVNRPGVSVFTKALE